VDVLHEETELLIPMMKKRGLPLHPDILETSKYIATATGIQPDVGKPSITKTTSFKKSLRKTVDLVAVNKELSPLPTCNPANGRNMLSRLEKEVVYSNY